MCVTAALTNGIMKYYLPLLFVLFNTVALFSQKNEISLDLRGFKAGSDVTRGTSVQYFRHTGLRTANGIRLNISTNQLFANPKR